MLMTGVAALQSETVQRKNFDCYNEDDKGQSYVGLTRRTHTGAQCAYWNWDKLENTVKPTDSNNDYCRNPDGSKGRPWCYRIDTQAAEECEVPKCTSDGPWARNFGDEAVSLKGHVGAGELNCRCAKQLYGSASTSVDTSVKGVFLQKKPCRC